MLKRVFVINNLGESIECKIEGVEAENDTGLVITSIEGLGPVKATINMTEIPSADGSIYNSSRLGKRNIVIKALFTHASSIEEARYLSYRYFPVKQKITLEIETDTRTGTVEGYVESNEPDIFSKQSSFQVSILCESAYFNGADGIRSSFAISDGHGDCYVNLTEGVNNGVSIDITPESSVTAIDLAEVDRLGNEIGGMSLDMSRLAASVPNTSPTDSPAGTCSFSIDLNTNTNTYLYTPATSRAGNYTPLLTEFIPDRENDDLYKFTFSGVFATGTSAYANLDSILCEKSRLINNEHWREPDISALQPPPGLLNYFYPRILLCPLALVHDDSVDSLDMYMIAKACVFDPGIGTFDHEEMVLYKLSEGSSTWVVLFEDTSSNVRVATPTNQFTAKCKARAVNGRIHMLFNRGTATDTYYAYVSVNQTRWTYAGQLIWEDYDSVAHPISQNVSDYRCHLQVMWRNGVATELHYLYVTYNSATFRHLTMDLSRISNTWHEVEEEDISPFTSTSLGLGMRISDRGESGKLYLQSADNIFECDCPNRNQAEWTLVKANVIGYNFNGFRHFVCGSYSDEYYVFFDNGPDGYTEPPNNTKLIKNDVLTICTEQGNKGVTLERQGMKYNAINTLLKNPTWFTLKLGMNHFTIDGSGIDEAVLRTNAQYEGM